MREQDFMKVVGNNIRIYRNRMKITQSQLAEGIERSLASVSKYERGECAIDSYTLYRIAGVLNVTTAQLLPNRVPDMREENVSENWNIMTQNRVLYLHNVGYISQKLCCSMLEIDWESNEAIMYVDTGRTHRMDYRQCSMILYGEVISSSACTSILVRNPSAPIDYFHIVINSADWYQGNQVCYVNYSTMNWRTVVSKGVLTTTPDKPENLEELLAFSKTEFKEIRKKTRYCFKEYRIKVMYTFLCLHTTSDYAKR